MQWGYHFRELTEMVRSHLLVTCRGADPHGESAVRPLFFNLPLTCGGEEGGSVRASSFGSFPPPFVCFAIVSRGIIFYCLISEYFATASPMIWMESQFPELNTMGGYLGFMDTRVQPSPLDFYRSALAWRRRRSNRLLSVIYNRLASDEYHVTVVNLSPDHTISVHNESEVCLHASIAGKISFYMLVR